MTLKHTQREAVLGSLAAGSPDDPVVIAVHFLQNKSYADMVRRRFSGCEAKMSAKFQMCEDDRSPPKEIKSFVGKEPAEILGCLEAIVNLRTALVGEAGRMTVNQMWFEAFIGLSTKGTPSDPVVVACHVLHVDEYVDKVLRSIKGRGHVSVRFQMREDDEKEAVAVKEFVDEREETVLDCVRAMAQLRKLLVGEPNEA